MKIKTTELTDAALDRAVAKALGRGPEYNLAAFGTVFRGWWLTQGGEYERMPSYSTDWSQGGPIIEREGISTVQEGDAADWVASVYDHKADDWHMHTLGETPLIAACRCYVASKLGDEVEIPEELAP